MSNVNHPTAISDSLAANADADMPAPDVLRLVRRRTCLSMGMSVLVLGVYFAFILIVAFAPKLLTRSVAAGSPMTTGIVVGIGLYWFCAIATGLYVWIADRWIDPLVCRMAR
ncbi:DUF485 domain-containing protein [Burkholderia sp. Nafp2/4-1b]|uniref:DUF485 domain-containing protein n=1 Tax=Burkholderia sp. Nafp2/4-1b TaxID=2116686 RepID=UPI000EF86FB8|nr:DUF485 domain-containing protein [Burkholderia sp. Nafp2/4-1b]RKU04743.1 DUF485 domain-containing protein [Burkholderia sp. Nafp2/4-1b]